MTILSDIKEHVGVDTDNLGFETELLAHINATAAALSQLGIGQYDTLVIEAETEWPSLDTPLLDALQKPYFFLAVRAVFDPIASDAIAKQLEQAKIQLEGRMAHEQEGVIP